MQTEDEISLAHINERLGELLDEVAGLMTWTLKFAQKNKIPLGEAFEFHVSRICSILQEIGHPPSLSILPVINGDTKLAYPTIGTTKTHPTARYQHLLGNFI